MLCQRCNIEIFHDFSHKHTSDRIIGAIHSLFYSTSDSSNPHLMMLKNLQYSDCAPDPVVDKIFTLSPVKLRIFVNIFTKGSCQVKQIREKLGSVRSHPPTTLSNFFFETIGNMKTTQTNTEKHNISKNKKSELGLNPPTHFRVFLGFLDFF